MPEPLLFQIEGAIATITFNRPERRNAITFAMWHELQRLLVDARENPQVRVIVVRGAGQEAFAAGADISEFATHRNSAAKATLYNAAFDAAMDAAEAVGKPTLCLIMGACVGGGCEFSTACDIRIAAENARFGVPIARLGLPVGFREMRRMVHLIGHAKTMELLLTADIIPAQEALRIGLVNHVVPLDQVEAFTYAMAQKIAALAPVVHRVHKEIVQTVLANPALEGLTPAQHALAVSPFDTADFQEGWQAFLAKRTPQFRGC
ncbi:MAG: enoyl-CoA hydratase [Candidatus Tectomicrobia bacterium]|uniref:Enoyl-CoA hydratase n=1 Tax=Tectimicrobiota bacterium TaxID=2528274 RepID=A0A937W1Q6_UNCTE|nr:enoyl-CoA hydratase [Candidatus Tectomicrobia bacterium]